MKEYDPENVDQRLAAFASGVSGMKSDIVAAVPGSEKSVVVSEFD